MYIADLEMKFNIFDSMTSKNNLVLKMEEGYKFKNIYEAR